MKNTVFSPANILLPELSPLDKEWKSYSVIACDQFTSEPEYWEKAQAMASGKLSTLGLILPEAYLGTDKENEQKSVVSENMKTLKSKLCSCGPMFVYVERTLPDGRVRPGIVGKVDLEEYDFSPDSASRIRATEETVIARIPPRVAVRKAAEIELPHVMVFANDTQKKLIEPLAKKKDRMRLLYSFDLMLGGGSIKGYAVEGDELESLWDAVCEYEKEASDGLVYAMGDGNHSLASAKAHFEAIKAEKGSAAMDHPARYALVEVVDLLDSSIEFEPIYRLLKNCDYDDFKAYVAERMGEGDSSFEIPVIAKGHQEKLGLPVLHALGVGSLQMIIDDYLRANSDVECDYIHGVDSLIKLSSAQKCVGFLCDGIEKSDLFAYVSAHGNLPRKTFSMGEAASKRYYLEARVITK